MTRDLQRKNNQSLYISRKPQLTLGTTQEGYVYSLTDQLFSKHKHILGISGSGKSFFMASLIIQLLSQWVSICLIDPHGDLARLVLKLLAASNFFSDHRAFQKLLYIDFSKAEDTAAIPFNFLKQPHPHTSASRTASNFMSAIKRAFPTDATTANLDMMLLNAGTLLAYNSLPLTRLPDIVFSPDFRERLLQTVSHDGQYSQVVNFFRYKFDQEKVNSQLVDSVLKRSWLLTFSPVLRNTLGQSDNTLNFSHLMNNQISCIFNLGGLDAESTKLLACLLTVGLEQAFLNRARLDEHLRYPYHVFIDEFPLFSAQSESSFTHILEQVRKYKGTLYLANQTLGQLSSGMASSLQNAVSIMMKAGYKDSNELQSNFYRPVAEKPEGFVDWLLRLFGLLPEKPQHAFAGITTSVEARAMYENLAQQEALVTINGQTIRILTNTIPPVNVDKKLLQDIEDTYTKLLLTPLAKIDHAAGMPPPVVTPATVSIPPRFSSVSGKQPVQTYAGVSGNDDELLSILSLYHYAQAGQIAHLLRKETSINNIRAKLKRLVEIDGLVEAVSLPRASQSGGKTPFVYTLSVKGIKYLNDQYRAGLAMPVGTRKHGRLEHTSAVNDLLIAAALLPCSDPKLSIVDFRHERFLKTTPVKVATNSYLVPDGFVQLRFHNQEYGYFLEIDRNSEDAATIVKKAQLYVKAAQDILQKQFSCAAFRVVFCVVQGGDSRAKQLTQIIESALVDNEDYGELFFIGNVPEHIAPLALFTTAPFAVPFDGVTQTLL